MTKNLLFLSLKLRFSLVFQITRIAFLQIKIVNEVHRCSIFTTCFYFLSASLFCIFDSLYGTIQKVQNVVANPAFLCGMKQSHAYEEARLLREKRSQRRRFAPFWPVQRFFCESLRENDSQT